MTLTPADTERPAADQRAPAVPGAPEVLAEISAMLRDILDEYGLDDAGIGLESRFHDDLELESIDLVTLGGRLAERYGDAVNFAEFVADLDLDEIIALTVGQLVEHVVTSLRAADGG